VEAAAGRKGLVQTGPNRITSASVFAHLVAASGSGDKAVGEAFGKNFCRTPAESKRDSCPGKRSSIRNPTQGTGRNDLKLETDGSGARRGLGQETAEIQEISNFHETDAAEKSTRAGPSTSAIRGRRRSPNHFPTEGDGAEPGKPGQSEGFRRHQKRPDPQRVSKRRVT